MVEVVCCALMVPAFALGQATIDGTKKGQALDAPIAKPPQSTGDTLIIGTTILRLGMSKDSVIPALALQYDLDDASATIGRYEIMAGKLGFVGELFFNAHGRLVAASKLWTQKSTPYSEGEIGSLQVW